MLNFIWIDLSTVTEKAFLMRNAARAPFKINCVTWMIKIYFYLEERILYACAGNE